MTTISQRSKKIRRPFVVQYIFDLRRLLKLFSDLSRWYGLYTTYYTSTWATSTHEWAKMYVHLHL